MLNIREKGDLGLSLLSEAAGDTKPWSISSLFRVDQRNEVVMQQRSLQILKWTRCLHLLFYRVAQEHFECDGAGANSDNCC